MTSEFKKDGDDLRDIVRKEYGTIAKKNDPCCGSSPCCGGAEIDQFAGAIGYSLEELTGLPEGANMGLSCGNPTALASLKQGEFVLDLGSGGGFDVFIAARQVGRSGKVIGVDMTPEMIDKARRNAESFRLSTGLDNVEFRLGEIEHLPVADASVDVVISNCVINLSPVKPQVWREIARVIKSGGRVAVSDLALLKPLPQTVLESVEASVGCVAGAVLVEQTRRMIQDAGLADIILENKSDYISRMSEFSDPLYCKIVDRLPAGAMLSDFITSLNISARKKP